MTRRPRGTSLVEVMVASVILITAMVGIIQLITQGATFQRRGVQSVNAVLYAQQNLDEYSAAGFAGLTVGTYDGGTVHDSAGRRFGRIVTVSDLTLDAGWPSFEVVVRVESGAIGENPLTTTARTVVPQGSDGGP
jgi:type II secretory pathway pseudopilin PulG